MVYCGKPSPGCGNCRKRRIKCDTKLPSCSQCIKAQRECPGYRKSLDVMFRDQTASVVDKHQKQLNLKMDKNIDSLSLSPISLKESMSDVAVNLLLTKYSIGSHFEFLSEQCRTSVLREPFRSSIQSLALARFANAVQDQDVAKLAMRKYNNAVIETSKTLQDPESARSDDTLASVLLLASFESTLTEIRCSTETWTRHIWGAYALMTLRGKDILKTSVGRSLFMQIVGSITLDSVQRIKPLPIKMLEMVAEMDATGPRGRFQSIIGDFIVLRAAAMKHKVPDSIEIAESLELRLEELAMDMRKDEIYQYQVFHQQHDEIPGGFYHKYSCPKAALLWNAIRMLRIGVQSHIQGELIRYMESSPNQAITSEQLLVEVRKQKIRQMNINMSQEVCASVPQFTSSTSTTVSSPDGFSREDTDDKWDRVTAIHFLIWPLYRVASTYYAPVAVREYAVNQLHWFDDKFNVRRARLAAYAIESFNSSNEKYHIKRALIPASPIGNFDSRNDDWMHVVHMF